MASSIGYLECKQCGGVAFNELNCNTLEEWQRCEKCGCGFDYELKRNKKGKVIYNRKKRPKYRFREWKGCGVVRLYFKNGGGVTYHLYKVLSKKNRNKFFEDIETNAEIDKERSYFTIWDKKRKKAVSVYGKMPPSYEETQRELNDKLETFDEVL